MVSVLEAVTGQAIESAESDMQFEAQALKAWEDYELTAVHVSSDDIDSMFASASAKAKKCVKWVAVMSRKVTATPLFSRNSQEFLDEYSQLGAAVNATPNQQLFAA
ncbi:MAG: hypothetical protein B6I37_01645 [Desulfobacteraceae bacterium 4572_35.2]|nr:MAG: hypothetical protein B6I37_01645 [Desulfobacteraceae bacterium 4572_35.2]